MMDLLTSQFRPEVKADLMAEYQRWENDIRYYCGPEGRFARVDADEALLIAALSIFNRRVVLVVDGVTRFHRRLVRQGVSALRVGNSTITRRGAKRYEDAVVGFVGLLGRLQVDASLMEVASAFELLERLDARDAGTSDG